MAFINSVPVVSSTRLNISRCAVRPAVSSSFAGARTQAARVNVPAKRLSPRMEFEISEGVDFKLDLTIVVLAMIGWIVPSSIPAGIPLTNGGGLSQAFFASMNENLANWPKGPALDDPFWTLLVLWHIGMFACLIFGTIGVNLRKGSSSS